MTLYIGVDFHPHQQTLAWVPKRNTEIYVINVDGSGLQRLTSHPARDSHPTWSKDGRKLIFKSDRSGRSAIYETDVPT